MEIVKKDDWQTLNMPNEVEVFVLEKKLNKEHIDLLKKGFLENNMDAKWFMYCEEDKMYIHRSWTGYCIYIVTLSTSGELLISVNRNKRQYSETNLEFDRFFVDHLISLFIARNIKK